MLDSRKLFNLRRQKGLTQEMLSRLSGLTKVTISELENRHRDNITLDTLSSLAKALDVKPADLLK
jgi:transcriptional regulator with XRE-family HTH domain